MATAINRPTDAPPTAQAGLAGLATTAAPAAGDDLAEADVRPVHVAVIMDGNRRWARARGLSDLEGHAAGVERIRGVVEHAIRRGIAVLSLYAFSRENWARSDDEVGGLFRLLEQAIAAETAALAEQGVRVNLLGRRDELPDELQRSLADALAATAGGARLILNVAFNYAGRTELVDAVRAIVAAGIPPAEIDEAAIACRLYTAGQPDPDLLIRTGGDQRLSNFLIWQAAYAELWSTPTPWPDFGPAEFDAALVDYARRTRRFGT